MWSLHRIPVLAWSRLMLPDHADRPRRAPPLPGSLLPAAVKAAGGQVLPNGSGVAVGGWTITTGHGPITSAPPSPPPPLLHRACSASG